MAAKKLAMVEKLVSPALSIKALAVTAKYFFVVYADVYRKS